MDTQEEYNSGLDIPAIIGIVIGIVFLSLILLICCVVACGPHLYSLYNATLGTPRYTSERRDSLEASRDSDYRNRRVIVGLGTLYPENLQPEMIPGHVTSSPGTSPSPGGNSQFMLSSPPPTVNKSHDLPCVQYSSQLSQNTECIQEGHLEKHQGIEGAETITDTER